MSDKSFLPVKNFLAYSANLFILIVFLFPFSASSQKLIVHGSIKDVAGRPVAFATVVIKSGKDAVRSDDKGNFKLMLRSVPAILVVKALGFETSETKINRKNLNDSIVQVQVKLKPETKELAEVVVTALGVSRKATSLGYSTASVSADAFGMPVSGLSVTSSSPRSSVRSGNTEVALHAAHSKFPKATASTEVAGTASNDSVFELTESRSRLLTAGELNDFKKWKMWEDYNTSEFKSYSEKWKLFATERYCVQLQNAEGKVITNEKVFLVSKVSGDTLWAAVTDNTGKAELWKGFSKKNKDDNLVIAIGKETKQFPAIPFAQGISRIVINRSCAVSNKAEIAFVVDATGSMEDEINYLKEELEDIPTKITTKNPAMDLHTASVFYRDKGDDYVTKLQEFTTGIAKTTAFIKQQYSGGGGDYPEAMNDGLDAAINKLQWSSSAGTRIIFLLMDAPPHDEASDQLTTLIIQAAGKGIRIIPVACSGTDKPTEFIMRSIALATNGSYLFLTDDSGIGNAHIKPTTDEIKVELLNDLLQRIIGQMCYVTACENKTATSEPLDVYNNLEKVKLFPNPARGPVTLQTGKKLKEIFIADFTGKILMRIPCVDKVSYQFDLSAFPGGTYFIKYVTTDKTMGTEKLVLLN